MFYVKIYGGMTHFEPYHLFIVLKSSIYYKTKGE